ANAGMIPRWFGKLHPRYRTPVNAIIFIGFLSALAPFLGEKALNWISDAGSPAIVIAYFLVSVGFLVLRRREPEMVRRVLVGGSGSGGWVVSATSAVPSLRLPVLWRPTTPFSAALAWRPCVVFGAWLLVGIFFMWRVPTGIKAGPRAGSELLAKVRA